MKTSSIQIGPATTGETAAPTIKPATKSQIAPEGHGPHHPGMQARAAALGADNRLVKGALNRVEPNLDKLDDRVRALEAFSKVDGKLDMIVAKMASWRQQPVSVV